MPAEKKYSVTEKEALLVYWYTKKLFQYLYGNNFVIKTDHKPLLGILSENKGIPTMASARLQRASIFLNNFQYRLEYIKGQNNHTSDLLSRLPLIVQCLSSDYEDNGSFLSSDYEDNGSFLSFMESEYFPVDRTSIKIETRKDRELSRVYYYLTHEWPQVITKEIQVYATKKNELYVEQGCVMLGYRVVIPTNLRKILVEEIHSTHLGIVKMKEIARSYIWWPGLDKDLEQAVKTCVSCLKQKKNP